MSEGNISPVAPGRRGETPSERLVRPPTRPLRSQAVRVEKSRTLPSMSLVERKQRDRRNAAIILLLIVVISLIGEAVLLLPRASSSPWLDVSLHSVLAADYNADLNPAERPVIGLGLLGDIYGEEGLFGIDSRMATLEAQLRTPVPSVTPLPGTHFPTATVLIAAATATPASTMIQPEVTSTSGSTPTATHTPTHTATPTSTLPGWTPSRTPTATAQATGVEPPDPTATRTSPPTNPPTATNPPPTPTRPPTETPDPYPYPVP